MSEQNQTTDNTVKDQHNEEVDYADPESPTLAIRRLPTTGPNKCLTDVVATNDNADTADTVLPSGAPTLATPADKAPTTSLASANSKRGSQIPNDDEVMVYSLSHPPMKRRRLDLGNLMVKITGLAKPISDKPVEHFRTV